MLPRPPITPEQRQFVAAHLALCQARREATRLRMSATLRDKRERELAAKLEAKRKALEAAAQRRAKPVSPRMIVRAAVRAMTPAQQADYRTFVGAGYAARPAAEKVLGRRLAR